MKKPLKIPTDRSFGLTFAGVFVVIGAYLLWKGRSFGLPALGIAAAFALLALALPRILHPLNIAWGYLGLLLNKVVSPVVLGIIFLVVFVPIGLLFRVTGRDALRRTFEPKSRSYWVDRDPPGPEGKSLSRQF